MNKIIFRIHITPQGGNTGLVGGSIPTKSDEIILSLKNMNKILKLNESSGILTVQSGCILENVEKYLRDYNLQVPWDLGAKGSCTIGGNLATNAGGIHFVRFGPLRSNILGIEAVLSDGRIFDEMNICSKDNTGYSLRNLIIGSEGTLAVITAANIQCHPLSKNRQLLLFPMNNDSKFPELVKQVRNIAGSATSALEFWDHQAQSLMENYYNNSDKNLISLFPQKYPFYILLELLADPEDDRLIIKLCEKLKNDDLIGDDVIIAQNENEFKKLWSIREEIPLICAQKGLVLKYDVTLPITYIYEIVKQVQKKLPKDQIVIGYGHLGDGNIHLNIPVRSDQANQIAKLLDPFIYKWVTEKHGSISAEHGIGQMKAPYLSKFKSKTHIDLMKGIKTIFDPIGILNKGKIFEEERKE